MTFTHLMNCLVLTYGPIYTIYSGSNLYKNLILEETIAFSNFLLGVLFTTG